MTNVINFNGELYVGGYFDSINGVPFSYIARYSNPTLGMEPAPEQQILLNVFPNPSTGKITVSYSITAYFKKAWLKANDSLGKSWYKKQIKDNSGSVEISPGLLPKGIYFITLECNKGKATVKVVVE